MPSKKTKIFLIGTSSAGKTSLTNKFPKSFTRIRIDDYYAKYFEKCKNKVLKTIKNKFIDQRDIERLAWKEFDKIFIKEVKNAKLAVIDDVSITYIDSASKSNKVIFLIYAPLTDMIRNIHSRRSTDTRDLRAFNHFVSFYVATCDPSKAIDTISRPQFIKELQDLKWLFESQSHLEKFVIDLFQQMGIVTDEPYMIKPRFTVFDYILNTKGKTIDYIYDEIRQIIEEKNVKSKPASKPNKRDRSLKPIK
jgi:hypothetical protein